jgi:hypothetical protein
MPTQRNYSPEIVKIAYQVWEVMHREAKGRGLALVKEKPYGDGRVMINTIGAFIKGLNKERAWYLSDYEVDLVRRYLKVTGNVVALSKVEQYKFRIFISEKWTNEAIVKQEREPDSISRRADKLTPEEAGETREPSEVTYRCVTCRAIFKSQTALNSHLASHGSPKIAALGKKAVAHLSAVAARGGKVESEKGLCTRIISEEAGYDEPDADSMHTLDQKGLIKRKVRGKRTYEVEMTKAGWEFLSSRNQHRRPRDVIEELL